MTMNLALARLHKMIPEKLSEEHFRQKSSLSPALFDVYIEDLTIELKRLC